MSDNEEEHADTEAGLPELASLSTREKVNAKEEKASANFPTTPPHTASAGNSTIAPNGTTKIERLVDKIQGRRARRMVVSRKVRMGFFQVCNQCAAITRGANNVIPYADLVKLKASHLRENKDPEVYKVLEHAVNTCDEVGERMFHFHEFCEYGLVQQKPLSGRRPLIWAVFCVAAYYFFSAVLFCGIFGDNSTCPYSNDADIGPYDGWLTSLYFASATLSTVGYGDVSVVGSGTETWRLFLGTVYMIVAMIIAVTVFSSLSKIVLSKSGLDDSKNVTSPLMKPLFKPILRRAHKKNDLNYRMRVVQYIRLFELTYYFVGINVFGMLVARFIFAVGDEAVDWSWMTTFYWAVQTTTTIGYGDLDMPFNLRWFNLFFTIIGTTFAASILASLSSLNKDLSNMRRFDAWKSREVSTRLVADMKSRTENQIDEYEFLVGSLIMLDKISKDDVREVMDKFRELAGGDDIITMEDISRFNYEVFEEGAADWRQNTSTWNVLGVSLRGLVS